MVQTGAAPGQRPTTLLRTHLTAKPWWKLPDIEAALVARAAALREELRLVLTADDQAPAADAISVASGRWSQHYLLEEGKWDASLLARLPVTRELLESLPICESSVGYCYYSTLDSGTVIQPHHGPTNVKLRCQFPLLLEDGCAASLCVNGEAQPYEEARRTPHGTCHVVTRVRAEPAARRASCWCSTTASSTPFDTSPAASAPS
jgi:hypothetical protein